MGTKSIWTKWMVLIFTAALLASCGGGGGGSLPAPGDEGSAANPVNLGTATSTLTHPGSIGADGMSYYKFTTGSAGVYTISLTSTASDLGWTLYNSAGTAIGWCDDFVAPGPANESCITPTLSASALYYVYVKEWDSVAGTFTLTVAPPSATPPAAPTGVSTTAGYGSVAVSWNTATGATSYNLYWTTGTSWNVISGITANSFVHSNLTGGTAYTYYVTAVNASGESAASSQVPATPTALGTPVHRATFDGGTLQGWSTSGTTTSTWGVLSASSNPQTYAVTDSPSGNYSDNSNTWLVSPVLDLTGTTTPTLRFYTRYSIESGWDFGYVEISTDSGATWTNITPGFSASFTDTLEKYTLFAIGLSAYKSSTVMIRFRLVTDDMIVKDGWYIDDILITP